ncbi:MAG: thiamine ABC transporter substrate-binding protein [Candidatus Kariarchaeaceae archaeon]|jgi:thiamine transport system substrate-binding protein
MKIHYSFLIIFIMCLSVFPQSLEIEIASSITVIDQSSSLIIYTYDSLLADPGYKFDREFEKFAGLANNSVEVVLLEDAGSIVTKAVAEKNSPVADVLIGIDNVLVEKARENDILSPYKPNGSERIKTGLVDALASDYLLTPYDYGVISLWYLTDKVPMLTSPDTFVLEDLLESDLAKLTIVENPTLSSPGLGFLLWTIAIFGDETEDITGIVDADFGDWEDYWRILSENVRIVNSWGDAISLMYTEEANRPMMVSYASSPAYGSCLWDDTSTKSVLSHENDQQWGWQQVEGIGLVKNAPHAELAQKFIDWFISDTLQSQIHENQWMYPAINGITPPECYNAAIDPSTIYPLNDQISRDDLKDNLDGWLDRWEIAIVEGTDEDALNLSYLFYFTIILLPIILKKRKILNK